MADMDLAWLKIIDARFDVWSANFWYPYFGPWPCTLPICQKVLWTVLAGLEKSIPYGKHGRSAVPCSEHFPTNGFCGFEDP